jgi:FixJ family two-component response regulator
MFVCPAQSGLDFQRELSDRNVALPIVFLTGHGDVPMSVRAMKAGAIEFLTKPFRDQDLLDARSKLPSIATGRRDKTPSCSTNCAGASIQTRILEATCRLLPINPIIGTNMSSRAHQKALN